MFFSVIFQHLQLNSSFWFCVAVLLRTLQISTVLEADAAKQTWNSPTTPGFRKPSFSPISSSARQTAAGM